MSPTLSKTTLFRLVSICLMIGIWGHSAAALEIPPAGSSAFLQTSGPATTLGVGDYYTSSVGEPVAANRFHRMEIYVPCAWPAASPITFAIYDPESSDPDPVPPAPSANDEVRPPANNTTYTLRAPNGTIIAGPRTFTPGGGTNGLWVEILTFTPGTPGFGCGVYELTNTTDGGNDDNAWRLRVTNDADCTVSPGTCSTLGAATSLLMDNGNEQNDIDGSAGTGDELVAGLTRTSYQHTPLVVSCQNFFQFVDGASPTVTFNNFDLDSPGLPSTITYFPPVGASITGTASGVASWNGSPDNAAENPAPPRTGDVITITPERIGWWRTEVCVGPTDNQYIFEGLEDEPVFFQPVPFPQMTINKDDGQTTVSASGQNVTYTIQYANTGTGAAIDAVITDTLPTGAAFVSCTGGCTGTAPVTWNLGIVPSPGNPGSSGSVTLTVQLPPAPAGSSHTNTVSIDHTDLMGNNYAPVTDTDIDTVVAVVVPTATNTADPSSGTAAPGIATATPLGTATSTLTPFFVMEDPFITKSVAPPFALPGEAVTWTIRVTNPGTLAINNVVVTDDMPDEVEIVSVSPSNGTIAFSGQTVTITLPSLGAGQQLTFQVRARVRQTVQTPFVIKNLASMTFDQATEPHYAQASVVSSVSQLPNTGESPWSRWRLPLFVGVLLATLGGLRLMWRNIRPHSSPTA